MRLDFTPTLPLLPARRSPVSSRPMRHSLPRLWTIRRSTKSPGESVLLRLDLQKTYIQRSQTCWLEPACIVTPANEQQLAEALNTLITTKTKFAIRSGGHSSSPGFGSIGADGVLVSLQNFNTLTMSPDNQTVTVGSGNRWRDVYSYVANYNVTVIGGREPPVGVGGFLLGGRSNRFISAFSSVWLVVGTKFVFDDHAFEGLTEARHGATVSCKQPMLTSGNIGGLGIFYNTYGLGLDNVVRYKLLGIMHLHTHC